MHRLPGLLDAVHCSQVHATHGFPGGQLDKVQPGKWRAVLGIADDHIRSCFGLGIRGAMGVARLAFASASTAAARSNIGPILLPISLADIVSVTAANPTAGIGFTTYSVDGSSSCSIILNRDSTAACSARLSGSIPAV